VRSSLQRGWQGPGLTSSLARSGETGLRAIAAFNNDDGTGQPIFHEFAGQVVDQNCILAKCTYSGDANLDGLVNADDYFQIDSGYITQKGGYHNGDFNYDGLINADDYFLIDSAFIGQSGPLGVSGPAPAATEDALVVTKPQEQEAYNGVAAEVFSIKPVL